MFIELVIGASLSEPHSSEYANAERWASGRVTMTNREIRLLHIAFV